MFKMIKRLVGVILIIFCVIALFVGILTIWDVISNETAKEMFINLSYTFGAVFSVSLLVLLITKIVGGGNRA